MAKHVSSRQQHRTIALFCSVTVTFAFQAIGWGQGQNTPSCLFPQPSDTAFPPIQGNNGLSLGQAALAFIPNAPPTQGGDYSITRVVGPGTPGEFNPADGTLANWSTYTANGILSPTAYVQVYALNSADGGDPLPSDHHPLIPYVNGRADATFTLNWTLVNPAVPGAQVPTDVCGQEIYVLNAQVPISTRYLKFPQRAANGSTPTPVLNQIAFATDSGNNFQSVRIGTLSFQAMAPIVLVHGIRANALWWENSFTPALDSLKIPWVIATKPGLQDLDPGSIVSTGTTLMSVIPSLAKEFGVSKVNIVAHSKGGLWSRYFLGGPSSPYSANTLAAPSPSNFGVLSLTTLDTPHDGSVLAEPGVIAFSVADFLVAARQVIPRIGPANPSQDVQALADFDNLLDQVSDLTPAALQAFNSSSFADPPSEFKDTDGTIHPTIYWSVAADADIGDKTFGGARFTDSNDCAGMGLPTVICSYLYFIVGTFSPYPEVQANGIYQVQPMANPPFQENDFVVTISSSLYSFHGLYSSLANPFQPELSGLRKNHSTVGDGCVAVGGCAGSGVVSGVK